MRHFHDNSRVYAQVLLRVGGLNSVFAQADQAAFAEAQVQDYSDHSRYSSPKVP
jgi:hypothetical protein